MLTREGTSCITNTAEFCFFSNTKTRFLAIVHLIFRFFHSIMNCNSRDQLFSRFHVAIRTAWTIVVLQWIKCFDKTDSTIEMNHRHSQLWSTCGFTSAGTFHCFHCVLEQSRLVGWPVIWLPYLTIAIFWLDQRGRENASSSMKEVETVNTSRKVLQPYDLNSL